MDTANPHLLSLAEEVLSRPANESYPIFSLRVDETLLLADMRGFIGALKQPWVEFSMSGKHGEEVGFGLTEDAMDILYLAMDEMPVALHESFMGWISSPCLSCVPESLDIPACYLPKLELEMSRAATVGDKEGEETLVLVNSTTREMAIVTLNYDLSVASYDRDVSSWRYWAMLPNVSLLELDQVDDGVA